MTIPNSDYHLRQRVNQMKVKMNSFYKYKFLQVSYEKRGSWKDGLDSN